MQLDLKYKLNMFYLLFLLGDVGAGVVLGLDELVRVGLQSLNLLLLGVDSLQTLGSHNKRSLVLQARQ